MEKIQFESGKKETYKDKIEKRVKEIHTTEISFEEYSILVDKIAKEEIESEYPFMKTIADDKLEGEDITSNFKIKKLDAEILSKVLSESAYSSTPLSKGFVEIMYAVINNIPIKVDAKKSIDRSTGYAYNIPEKQKGEPIERALSEKEYNRYDHLVLITHRWHYDDNERSNSWSSVLYEK